MLNQTIVDVIEDRDFPRTEEVGCALCGAQQEPRQIAARFGMTAMVAECPACRLAYQTPRPSQEASLAYMNWRWRSSDQYVSDTIEQMRRATQQMAYVQSQVRAPTRLLDFGAGAGSFVRAALDQGWDAIGVEQSASAIERAKQFYNVDLCEMLPDERYEVITLWDVIEHLRDPEALLRQLSEHLTPEGLLFIETGNYESWRRLADGDRWSLYLFDHQYYFTPHSLAQIMRRAGFTDIALLNAHHGRPHLHPKHLLRQPGNLARSWIEWAKAKARWPDHGGVGMMVVVGRIP